MSGGERPGTEEQTMNGPKPQLEDLVRALAKRRLLVVVGSLVREAAGLMGPHRLVAKGLEAEVFGEGDRGDIRVLAGRGSTRRRSS